MKLIVFKSRMRLPGERYGNYFTRSSFSEFKFTSLVGGLNVLLSVMRNNTLIDIGNAYTPLVMLNETLNKFAFQVVEKEVEESINDVVIDDDIISERNVPPKYKCKVILPIKDIEYILTFSINDIDSEYINDTWNRMTSFECLHEYIKTNKVNYGYDELSDICVNNCTATFNLTFNQLNSLEAFMLYRLDIIDSTTSLYCEYNIIRRRGILVE